MKGRTSWLAEHSSRTQTHIILNEIFIPGNNVERVTKIQIIMETVTTFPCSINIILFNGADWIILLYIAEPI